MDKDEKEIMMALDCKLSLIAALLIRKEESSIKDKVALADSVSLSNKDASRILGISESHFAKEKSLLKKKNPASNDKIIETDKQGIQNDQPKVEQPNQ